MKHDRFQQQDTLYEFPYHYLPTIDKQGAIRVHQKLAWGLEYMTYMSFIFQLIKKYTPSSLLDVGCGDGRLISMVKSSVPYVAGVDLSSNAIAFAKAFNPNIDFFCNEVSEVPGNFEMMTLIEVLEHIPASIIPSFVESLGERLHRQGILIISVPTVNLPLNSKHYCHYSLNSLSKAIQPIFRIQSHWWIYKRGLFERMIRTLLNNQLYTLNSTLVCSNIWRLHKRISYFADSSSGSHLICLATTC
jgi:2-polyprenyl-3-methyl-5-hydroxy-6-metoxy-1,4-benzoquinol methylase